MIISIFALKISSMTEMMQLVQDFAKQLREALSIGERFEPKRSFTGTNTPHKVVITGLGGSGIGGTIGSGGESIASKAERPGSIGTP